MKPLAWGVLLMSRSRWMRRFESGAVYGWARRELLVKEEERCVEGGGGSGSESLVRQVRRARWACERGCEELWGASLRRWCVGVLVGEVGDRLIWLPEIAGQFRV